MSWPTWPNKEVHLPRCECSAHQPRQKQQSRSQPKAPVATEVLLPRPFPVPRQWPTVRSIGSCLLELTIGPESRARCGQISAPTLMMCATYSETDYFRSGKSWRRPRREISLSSAHLRQTRNAQDAKVTF